MSILITGGDYSARLEKAKEWASLEFDVSKIDDIRELQQIINTNQSVIISHAENLSEEAQNALLKVLEESETTVVLLAENEHQLLSTVVSRCFIQNLEEKPIVVQAKKIEDIKTREEALAFVDNLMLTRDFKIMRQLFQAKKYLKANTNVRLTLENLLQN